MEKQTLQKQVWNTSLVLAPILLAAAQFFWDDGRVTTTAGVLQVLAFTVWIFSFQGLFQVIRKDLPTYSVIGFILAAYACIGGNNFGVDGIYTEAMGFTDLEAAAEFTGSIGSSTLAFLFIPGGLFPLSMMILSVQLTRKKKIRLLTGVLFFIGALCFPLSRIPRIDMLAHIDNLILLIAHLLIYTDLKAGTENVGQLQTA
ncbi:MAG TPA: hypothetical protein PK742_04080 [Chitinophagales bacterium]|nr:hypothetical protein [Bacteroidota bacterium]HQU75799.1 hypothetical protein [Chitinophagales bacterium]